MAERRMFSKKIIDTDSFLEMPATTRLLYYELSMRADDDGFVSSPKKITRATGCTEDDLKLLIAKQYIIPFDSGVCVIRDWKINNYIQKDRYRETIYTTEKSLLLCDKNGVYTICIQNGYNSDTQDRLELGKDRLELEGDCKGEAAPPPPPSPEKPKRVYGEFQNVRLTDGQYAALVERLGKEGAADYLERLSGWLAEGHTKRNHYATILNWWRKDAEKRVSQRRYKVLD